MLLYAITNRSLLGNNEAERSEKLVTLASNWAASGVDFIQIREKDLAEDALTRLASQVVRAARLAGNLSRILINADPKNAAAIALETGADGVHLPGGMSPVHLSEAIAGIRTFWQQSRDPANPRPISVSCHTVTEVRAARSAGATLALFAPVFEKVLPGASKGEGQGLEALAEACHAAREPAAQPELPVLALGGVTLANIPQCIAAGAAGIAAIRLFLDREKEKTEEDWRRLTQDRHRDATRL
jgi:thiamine-phosphate pyrophosphorylase